MNLYEVKGGSLYEVKGGSLYEVKGGSLYEVKGYLLDVGVSVQTVLLSSSVFSSQSGSGLLKKNVAELLKVYDFLQLWQRIAVFKQFLKCVLLVE